MHFITACKDYNNEVIKPSLSWLKKYWKEYFLFTAILYIGVFIYYSSIYNMRWWR